MVRTSAFQALNPGPIPGRVTPIENVTIYFYFGGVAERLKAPVSKTGIGETQS